jgi:hypothetical protein
MAANDVCQSRKWFFFTLRELPPKILRTAENYLRIILTGSKIPA